jgi:hypothetical protein
MLPEKAFQPIGKRMTLEGGCSGSAAPTQTTVTNTNIPDYAQPYVMNMLNAAQSQIYNPSGTGFNAYTPYSTNPANYVAGFSPMQQAAQSTAANMTMPSQFGQATSATQSALAGLGNLSYSPQTGGFMSTSAPALSNYTMTGPGNVAGVTGTAAQTGAAPTNTAAQLGAAPTAQAAQFQGPGNVSSSNVNAPNLSMYQMGGVNAVNAPGMQTTNMQAAQTGYNPQLNTYQMGPAGQVGTQDFTQPGTAQQYMNPYLQASLDPQLAEIQRQYGITGQQEQAGATQAGAFGGSREALMAAENQRNANTAMNQTISQGYNTAFNNAQNQFNAQQAANLQAQQANQQAGLTVGGQNLNAALGVQQLGTQTGMQTALANLSNAQQANVQNQAAQLQASGMNATQALQAALANQTMGYNVGNTNLNAALGIQQLGAGQNLQAQQLNQASGLQAALANQGMGYNTALQNAQFGQQAGLANQALAGQYGMQNANMAQQSGLANQALAGQYGLQNAANQQQMSLANQQALQQANLANQQMGFNVGNTNLQSLLGVQQLGSGQNLQSQLANQSAAAQAQQLAAQQQQFGANLGLQGLQAQLAGANQLGNLGTNQLAAQTSLLGTQNTLGAQQQAQQQQIINQAIQNYATAQQYPYMQLSTLNSLLRGLPMQSATTQMYQAAPSGISQLAGLGTAALGASSLIPKVKRGGLMDVQKMAMGGSAIPMKMMSNDQLQDVQNSPSESAIAKIIAQGQQGLNGYISNNPESSKVFAQPLPLPQQGLPPQQQVAQAEPNRVCLDAIGTGDMTKMAGGGILAFADGDQVPDTSAHRFSHEGSSLDDLAYDAEMNKSFLGDSYANHKWLAEHVVPAAKAGLKYTVGLPITAAQAVGDSLSGFYNAAHPTFDKSGNIVKQAEPAPEAPGLPSLTREQETQKEVDKYNAWKAKNNPPTSVANGLGFDQMMANNPDKLAQLALLQTPPRSPAPAAPAAGNAPVGAPAGAPAPSAPAPGGYDPTAPGLPMAANPDGFIHTSFGDVPIRNGKVDFAGIDTRKGSASSAMEPDIAEMKKAIDERTSQMKDEALLRLGLGMMAAPARTGHNWADALTNLGTAGTSTLNWMGTEGKENQADINKMNQMRLDAVKADQTRDLSFLGTVGQIQASMANKEATLEAQKQLHDERLAEIDHRYQDKSEDKKLAIDQENYRYIRGQYDHTKDSHYKELTLSGMDDATAQKAAEAYAWNMYKDDPNFRKLGIPKTDMPPPPPKKKSGWDLNPFDNDNPVPAAVSAPAQGKFYLGLKKNQKQQNQ